MRTRIPLLFAALTGLSSSALGQGNHSPAPPSDSYTDKESGFVFPSTAGPFHRGKISPVANPKSLWIDYGGHAPEAKVQIRIILRKREAGPDGVASCVTYRDRERAQVKHWPYFAGYSDLRPPQLAGYAATSTKEDFGLPNSGGTGYDFYYYCSRTTPWMVVYGFQRAPGIDATEQEVAFMRRVKPPGT